MKNYKIYLFFILAIQLFPFLSFSQEVSNSNMIDNNEPTNIGTIDTTLAPTNFLEDFYAEQTNVSPSEEVTESPAITLLRILLITGILGFLTWILLRFFFRQQAVSTTIGGRSIEVLATIPAGLGSYFLVAKLSNLYYLFSLSSDGIRLLDKITDQEAIDFIELHKEQTLPQEMKFIDLLDHVPQGKARDALEFLRDKISQLRNK